MRAGVVLLSGGEGRRMGAPKHALPHPDGGSWGGHLIGVFESVFPEAPLRVLGDPLPDRPELSCLEDPRQGPALALRAWAKAETASVDRWWIVACDQVRWTPERLRVWTRICEAQDPLATHWVMALHEDHLQPLGGWLPDALRPALARSAETSLYRMASGLPHLALPQEGPEWRDVDTSEERRSFESEWNGSGC